MSSCGAALALLDSPLFEALGPELAFALAWLGLAAVAAIKRRALRAAGAAASWLPIAALLALALLAAPWPFVRARDAEDPARRAKALESPANAWTPRAATPSRTLDPASWRELQVALVRAAGAEVAVASTDAGTTSLLVPPHWRLPGGSRLAAPAAEPTPATRASDRDTWVLEHASRVRTRRSFAVAAWRPAVAAEAACELVLEAKGSGESAWSAWSREQLAAGAERVGFAIEAPAPGWYALRLRRSESEDALVDSAIEIAKPPLVRALGSGLASLVAGLRAQGYEVAESGAPEASDELVILGAGVRELAASEAAQHYVEGGGGLFLAHPEAWEAAQASAWGHALPARIEPEAPPANEEQPNPSEQEEPRAPDPQNEPPKKEEGSAGRFALFVVLDLSGSFRTSLPGAWAQLESALRAAEGFELIGIAGFNEQGRLLLPLGAHGDRLGAALSRERQQLQRYVDEGGRRTLILPALRVAATELEREAPAATLLVVISDGIFDDRKSDWEHLAEQELVLRRGYVIAAIQVVDETMRRTYPAHALQSGRDNMDRLAAIGLTKKTSSRPDLGSAIRYIPVVARDVRTASSWTPRAPGGKPPRAESRPRPAEPEAPAPIAEPLIPAASGAHPVEGLPGELDGAPWPALAALRRVRLGAGAAPAWIVAPRREPLLVTGTIGEGRIALAASVLDASGWPTAERDARFPLFAARIADVIRRGEPLLSAWRARARDGTLVVEPAREREQASGFLAATSEPAGALQGSARRDAAGRLESTLRGGDAVSGLEAERPLGELLASTREGSRSTPIVAAAARGAEDPSLWLAALGAWLGSALALESALRLWARARSGAR